MKRTRHWGLREWALAVTVATGTITMLGAMMRAYQGSTRTVVVWVHGHVAGVADSVARSVVHDSLDAERHKRSHR